MTPRRAARRDPNEREIVAALEGCGWSVQRLDAKGVPDLLIGKGGRNVLMEVKSPLGPRMGRSRDGQHLSEAQTQWHGKWRGQVCVVRSVEEALGVVFDFDRDPFRGVVPF